LFTFETTMEIKSFHLEALEVKADGDEKALSH
jgi:hypothetical protein